ncbi:cobalt-precorrin-3b C17-methyltransferase [Candidatus Kuenenia stuttgartiensis]|uniref:Cobalt-precorrin-3b C17-methyltransferase n=1 Tax=Kuenenia stuttgartiensis TaxID=174633 RepID=A0A2C9CKP3_KUEST|nr:MULTISPECIES: precorrin-3B C(17)-methyltransferase [Kuenenia]MBE7549213.1 precorrin-3B C(17)-methyltransferase [Planctomycetia bacterium]MCZ7623979.1 precorrin-3B C(17)-methyltransferase [Candidatus Kuenenia sp.]QII12214.1 cobalt-precorrin-3b C17-methyltransferase [Candidatus Kuenenia stuttgartiensis]TVM00022.1 MAG: precorrin-3B C(17)-methyltransferase [Candidatus Kuenenia stuttgartiensis]SOH06143.1 strongly similar to uroporphyrinogen III synthase/methyltransferase [Candidatus Kuenenia stu
MVGIGPGSKEDMSVRALEAVKKSDTIIGYRLYVDLLRDITSGKEIISSAMRKEVERVELAIREALKGKIVSLISSGDSGVYGMAGLVMEMLHKENICLPLEIIPGIPAANAAAALLGAPLMHDYAVISLSDLLTPWETIEKRVKNAAEADFVMVIYNPKSSQRNWQLKKTVEIILKYKNAATPVGVVKNAKREGESIAITTLGKMDQNSIDMMTIVIIGNASSFTFQNYMVTKRGYNLYSSTNKSEKPKSEA